MAWTIEDLENRLLIGSTLVEGSTLSEQEAREVLAGRTVQGHSVREVRELANYRIATDWLMREIARSPYLSMDLLLGYHARLMHGLDDEAGRLKAHHNYTMRSDGTRFDYLHPARVEAAVSEWIAEFNAPAADGIAAAAALYARFQAIHPFADGNGRIGRVLLAYYLHRESKLGFSFYASDKLAHLRAVEATDSGDLSALTAFIRARVDP